MDNIDRKPDFAKNNYDKNCLYDSPYIDDEIIDDKIVQITYYDNDPDENDNIDEASAILGHLLLVHSSDNAIRMIKIEQEVQQVKYVGLKTQMYPVRHCLSPNCK